MRAALGINYAVGASTGLQEHVAAGGFNVDMLSGAATAVSNDRQYYINVHGALMSVSWVLLLPLGTMFPAHRWVGALMYKYQHLVLACGRAASLEHASMLLGNLHLDLDLHRQARPLAPKDSTVCG